MPIVVLRIQAGASSPGDIQLNVQDKTFEYLMSSTAEEVRVSAYFDRDWPEVSSDYEELFVHDDCPFEYTVTQIIPGSRFRKNIELPGPMKNGEQLVILIERQARSSTGG